MEEVTTKIICDTCNADLSPKLTSYPRIDILVVSCMNIAEHNINAVIYDVYQVPLLERDLHFCGFDCMTNYKRNS